MYRPSFSTLACPDWTLERVADAGAEYGFLGVELRTFGPGSSHLASDPVLTDEGKTRAIFSQRGISIESIATSSRFDQTVTPPVIGFALGGFEAPVRDVKLHIDLADRLHAPLVRVFAFEPAGAESPKRAMGRIVKRLKLAVDAARHSGARIALENGGGWPRAEQILEIVNEVSSPLLGVSYSMAVGARAGDDAPGALAALGDRLLLARMKDHRDGAPCALGEGEAPCSEFAQELARSGWSGPLVFEWDRMWMPELASAERVLPAAAERMYEWGAVGSPTHKAVAAV
ncbi:MAG: sugar phosphate isomerase/epimerase [Phycisphaeraceae bacterium]|nr:MAG: sugar phosphate isomerase/epimerase [Phycisphaeraceae bacterium]